MSHFEKQPTLDCQACGDVIRKLTAREAQQVALRPYDFVAFCFECRAEATEHAYG